MLGAMAGQRGAVRGIGQPAGRESALEGGCGPVAGVAGAFNRWSIPFAEVANAQWRTFAG
jgi:hypothetical protein